MNTKALNEDKVSIIVPVYNVENYIERCVNSLRNQDYQNIEIILVDDGSTDNCPSIIDKIAETESRIVIIHKKNGGVSAARNAGIDASCGSWIMFVDGDDWVEKDYVSCFVNSVKKSGLQVGMGRYNYSVYDESEMHNSGEYTITDLQAIEWIYSGELFVAAWNKIYSSEIVKTVRFKPEIWYGEGMLFNIECLQKVDSVSILNKSVYHQTFNPESAMRYFNLKSNYCGIASLWLQKAVSSKWNEEINQQWQYHLYKFTRSISDGLVRSGQVEKSREVFDECVHNIRKDLRIPFKYEKSRKAKLVWLIYSLFPKMMAKRSAEKFKENAKKVDRENAYSR